MKRTLPLLLLALLFAASTVTGDTSGDGIARVQVDVNPNVTVGVNTPNVVIPPVQTGQFSATIDFRVDANVQEVCLQVEATYLYKGDDPTNDEVAPIPLDESVPVIVDPSNANPLDGASNEMPLGPTPGSLDGFESRSTGILCFESSQNNHFSQDVLVTVTWDQIDPEQPTGQYSGFVRLIVLLEEASPV